MTQTNGESPPFPEINYIDCHSVIDRSVADRNVQLTWDRGIPLITTLPEFNKTKDHPLAIVLGGPSLNQFLDRVARFKSIMVCGSAHDHLIEQGIIPTYAVVSDPQPIHVEFLKRKHPDVTYLMDSRVDPSVFDFLEGHKMVHWNAYGECSEEVVKGKFVFGWGGFTSIKSIAIAIMLGFWDQHFFGMDSCVTTEGTTHAYDYEFDKPEDRRKLHTVMIENGRMMRADASMIAQAQQFFKYWELHSNYFSPTIYGEGLIAEMIRCGDPAGLKHLALANCTVTQRGAANGSGELSIPDCLAPA